MNSKDSSIPAWRAACEKWVTNHVFSEPGIITPFYELYNAYIGDNPHNYMDIGQFGKVLKARFPNKKRRRGKQGAQVYVYQDVVLNSTDLSSDCFNVDASAQALSKELSTESSCHQAVTTEINKTPSSGPVLLEKSDTEKDCLLKPADKFEENIMMDNSNHQNSYSLRSKIQQENNPRESEDFEIEIDSSQREDNANHFSGRRYSEKVGIDLQHNHYQQVNSTLNCITEKNGMENRLSDNSFKGVVNMQFDKYFNKLHTTNGSYLTSEEYPVTEDKTHEFSIEDETNAELTIDMSRFCIEQQLKSEIEVMDVPIPDGYPSTEEAAVPQNVENKSSNSNQIDEIVSSSTQADEKYFTAANPRLAFVRRWIDCNVRDSLGTKTYAKDFEMAYAQDHPDEPITSSSMAVLIRGKFPGRRKRLNKSNGTVFFYQDLELVKKKLKPAQSSTVPILPSNTLNHQSAGCKTYEGIMPSPAQAVIVTQPNVNTIAVCNPSVNRVNYPGLSYVALQVMPQINPPQFSPPQYEPLNFSNFKPSLNFRQNPVNVSQPVNLNPNISYILPSSAPPPVQPVKFTPVPGQQNLSPTTLHPLNVPYAQEQNCPTTTNPSLKISTLRHNQLPTSHHSINIPPMQKSVPIAPQLVNVPPLQSPNTNPVPLQPLKITSVQGSAPIHEPQQMPPFYEPQQMPPSSYQESYASDIPNDDIIPVTKHSHSMSLSPLMRIIKEEPTPSESNSSFVSTSRSRQSPNKEKKSKVTSYDSDKLRKMMESVLPDMDVNDYISREISEANKMNGNRNIAHYQNSLDSSSSNNILINSADYYSKTDHNPSIASVPQRKDIEEVTSTGASLPLRTQNQDSIYQYEINEVNDNIEPNNSLLKQQSALDLSSGSQDKNKKPRRAWDEDIRKALSGDKNDKKQNNSKHKRKHSNRKRYLYSQDLQMSGISKHFMRDSIRCNYPRLTDTRSIDSNLSTRSIYTRIRDMHQGNSNEVRPVHTGIPTVGSTHSYSGANDSLQQMQMITSRASGEYVPPSSMATPTYPSRPSNRPLCMPLVYEPHQQQGVNAALQTAKCLLKDIGSSLSETEIAWKLESALYEENPAAVYSSGQSLAHCSSGSSTEVFPCSVTPALKELTRNNVEFVDQLLHHQQSCQGLGCSEKCKTLRAAYTHIYIFNHRCQVYMTFTKIFSKHSRACRLARCPLSLCLFMKHELHLSGISVLPMQFPEDRNILEEQFRRCEKVGSHNAGLQCRHLQVAENVNVSEPNHLLPGAEETRGLEGNNTCAREIKRLLEEAHRNNNTSQSVLRMLQVLVDMMRSQVQ